MQRFRIVSSMAIIVLYLLGFYFILQNKYEEKKQKEAEKAAMHDEQHPMTHTLKTWPEYYQAIIEGKKTFDIREDDRPFTVGDFVRLEEWNPTTKQLTGRIADYKITYLMRGGPFAVPGRVILSLGEVDPFAPVGYPAKTEVSEGTGNTALPRLHYCASGNANGVIGFSHAVDDCREHADGRLEVENGEYGTYVNFCPFCGFQARTPVSP